ncbi:hypothetical protein GQ55_1G131000 [Panicum hallii var. hallii]|uniref:Uncharacterized protein n=1 Tax=Panicum hallii var. hallii TaxID=1504633 RepID=A0A2T7F524_9POAL|nr:hypothetical protein GQ55_1G131000 [Panicum hallii var. hallii]
MAPCADAPAPAPRAPPRPACCGAVVTVPRATLPQAAPLARSCLRAGAARLAASAPGPGGARQPPALPTQGQSRPARPPPPPACPVPAARLAGRRRRPLLLSASLLWVGFE